MSQESEQIIVQNDTASPMTQASVIMSQNLNGTGSRRVIPVYDNAEVSAANPLPPGQQATRDISNLNRRYSYARFRFRFGSGPELSTGPYLTSSPNRFMQQIRLAVVRTDGKYVQVQIEDQQPFNLQADEDAKEFDDNPEA